MQSKIDKTINRTHDGVVTANFKDKDEYIDQNINIEDINVQDNKKAENHTIFKSFDNEDKQCGDLQVCEKIVDAYNKAWIKQNNNESPVKSDDPQAKLTINNDKEDDNIFNTLEEATKNFVEFCKNFNEFYTKEAAVGKKIFKILNKYHKGEKTLSAEDVKDALKFYSENKKNSCFQKISNCFKKTDHAKIEQKNKVKTHIANILADNKQPLNNENQTPNDKNWLELAKAENQQPDIAQQQQQ